MKRQQRSMPAGTARFSSAPDAALNRQMNIVKRQPVSLARALGDPAYLRDRRQMVEQETVRRKKAA